VDHIHGRATFRFIISLSIVSYRDQKTCLIYFKKRILYGCVEYK